MAEDFQHFLDILKHLVRHPSVVGAEHPFFRVLQRELEETGASVTLYQGILVAEGSRPHEMFLSAHCDRHGLVCTGPNEFQYAAYVANRRGDLLGNSISEKMFSKVVDRFTGRRAFAYEFTSGIYLGAGEISKAFMCPHRANMVFEVDGLEHIRAGTPVAYQDRLSVDGGLISGQLDNVLTVAMLIYLFRTGYTGTAFFTAQEEAGRSWRFLLEWFNRFHPTTDNLIVLDTSPFASIEEASAQLVVLRRKDANGSFSPATTSRLSAICDELEINFNYKDQVIENINKERESEGLDARSIGSTELGRIVAASEGRIQGTTLQVPTTGYHTVDETASIEAVKAVLDVLKHATGLNN